MTLDEIRSIHDDPAYRDPTAARWLDLLAQDIYAWSVEKGFWAVPLPALQTSEAERYLTNLRKTQKLMLVVTELAELVEGLRTAEGPSSSILGYTNEEEEIADAIIRLLDYAGAFRLRIGQALLHKMAYNVGRPRLHGKEF
jgi:NTP pyrophosphatase (non-canonical NTP hydrolase)